MAGLACGGVRPNDTMARRTQQDAERTRRRIIASALSLFAERGYEKTTFEDVARRMNMTKGAVYWHFPDKQSLLLEVVKIVHARFERAVVKGPEAPDMAGAAEIMADQAVRIVSDPRSRCMYRLLHSQIRWSGSSMAEIRARVVKSQREGGPIALLSDALAKEKAAGRLRAGVDIAQTAGFMVLSWSSLVGAAIGGFLDRDVREAVKDAFAMYRGGWERDPAPSAENVSKTGRGKER